MMEPPMPDPAIVERAATDPAIDAAKTAVAAVNDTSDDATIAAAEMAVAGAGSAISAAATHAPADEASANSDAVNAL